MTSHQRENNYWDNFTNYSMFYNDDKILKYLLKKIYSFIILFNEKDINELARANATPTADEPKNIFAKAPTD